MKATIPVMLILLVASSTFGHVTEVGIAEVAKIHNDRGEFRLLVRLEDPKIPSTARVDFATLVLPMTTTTAVLSLEVRPLTSPWSGATVTWDEPWQRRGGDLGEEHLSRWTIHPGVSGPGHFLDITEIVRMQVRSDNSYGFMILPADAVVVGRGAGFSSAADAVLAGLEDLKVRVLWSEAG